MYPAAPENTALVQLHDHARLQASRLRREATDEFWRGAHALWMCGLAGAHTQVQRSAARLKARLSRRAPRSTPTTRKA